MMAAVISFREKGGVIAQLSDSWVGIRQHDRCRVSSPEPAQEHPSSTNPNLLAQVFLALAKKTHVPRRQKPEDFRRGA